MKDPPPPRGTENAYMHIKLYWTNCLPFDSLGLKIRVICPIVWFLGNTLCKCLDRTVSKMPMVGQLSDSVLSNCSIIKQSNGWFMLCLTVRLLVIWLSNSPMFRLCFFQLSNGQTVLYPTFQNLENAVSNCLMVGQYCV